MCVDLLIYIAFVKEVGKKKEKKKFWGILVVVSLTACFSVLQFVAFQNRSDRAAEVLLSEDWLSRGFCCQPSCPPGARKKKKCNIFFFNKKNALFFSEIHLDNSKLCHRES